MVNPKCMFTRQRQRDLYGDNPTRPDSSLPPQYDGGFIRIQNGHWMDTETGEVYTRDGHNVASKRESGLKQRLASKVYSILAKMTGVS